MKFPSLFLTQSFRQFFRNRCPVVLLISLQAGLPLFAAPGDITTVVGNGIGGFSGDGSSALSASINYPQAIALDPARNLFITDLSNHRIRRVDAITGIITTIAGTGVSNYNGDGIPAVDAQLSYPDGVAVASNGDVYIADFSNHRVRRVDAVTGLISTVAGTGVSGFDGDGPATTKRLNDPVHLFFDAAGRLLIADVSNERIRKLDLLTGMITTIAGTGTAGFNGDGIEAISANLNQPTGVVADREGNVYFADQQNNRIRRIDAVTGLIATLAGDGTYATSGDGGPATAAQLSSPTSLCLDAAGNLFIVELGTHIIRRIDADSGIITTVAGQAGFAGFTGDGGPALDAALDNPYDLVFDDAGNLFFSDAGNHRIRRIEGVGELAAARLSLTRPRPFPPTAVGKVSKSQRIGIRNEGNRPLLGITARVGGGDRRDFRIKSPAAGSIEAGDSTSFSATFRPRARGKRVAQVIVNSSNGGSQKITLSGKGR